MVTKAETLRGRGLHKRRLQRAEAEAAGSHGPREEFQPVSLRAGKATGEVWQEIYDKMCFEKILPAPIQKI